MDVSDLSASVPFKDLFIHTLSRFFDSKVTVPVEMQGKNPQCEVLAKWGFDGSSSQSIYKQKIQEEQKEDQDIEELELSEDEQDEPLNVNTSAPDSSIVAATWLPLQVKLDGKVVWTNSKPSSTRLCRPLRITFTKESDPYCKKLREEIEEEIKNTSNVMIDVGKNTIIKANHSSMLTMVDGKTFNLLANTKSKAVVN
eukprot:Pompholyxophrys_punicea_v1_NODE_409_length_2031_cov_8.114879.p1 type:complete len:198 gc:universal NODE_409_length_2031_cov_8.114879:610-1203(+)